MQNISVFEIILNEARAGAEEEVDTKGLKGCPTTPSPNIHAYPGSRQPSFLFIDPRLVYLHYFKESCRIDKD